MTWLVPDYSELVRPLHAFPHGCLALEAKVSGETGVCRAAIPKESKPSLFKF